jgi:hypothetical protein
MPLHKKQAAEKIDIGWVATESGYQKTRSPLIIMNSVTSLKKARCFLTLTRKGYFSGNTILVDYSAKHLVIDRPLDWPPQQGGLIFIRFQDKAKLLNHYKAKIIKVTHDSIFTEFPVELFQLQRRQYYRVQVPSSNNVSFQFRGSECSGLIAQDISIRGILIFKKSSHLLEIGDEVNNLTMEIYDPVKNDTSKISVNLQAQQGEVVRLDRIKEIDQYFAGLKLFPDRKEEKLLQKYIHQRELSDLRKH